MHIDFTNVRCICVKHWGRDNNNVMLHVVIAYPDGKEYTTTIDLTPELGKSIELRLGTVT